MKIIDPYVELESEINGEEILKKIDEIYLVVIHVNPIEVKNDKGRNI